MNLYKRDFSNFSEREFQEEVLKMNWDNICYLKQNDPNLSCNNFFNSITYLLDEFTPFKKVTRNEYKLMLKPWISKEILLKCKRRDFILKNISKENDPDNKIISCNDYKKLRNEITKDKRDSKKSYYYSYPKKISQTFNYYFSTVRPKIEQEIPTIPGNFRDYFNRRDMNGKLLINSSNSSFFF